MKWSDKGGEDFKQPPLGTLQARCYRVIDLGTQRHEYQGKVSFRRDCMIGWELPNDLMDDGRPFTVAQFYTASLNEKSNLRHALENWRSRPFTETELAGFDPKVLLGKECLLGIIDKGGKARVGGVMAQPKNMTCPPQVNPSVYLSLEPGEFDRAVYDALSDGIKAIIAKSPEYVELQNPVDPTRDQEQPPFDPDDIPF